MNLKKFERLSNTQYGTIRHFVIDEGLVSNSQIESIIEQITTNRFNMGKAKCEFARTLDLNEPEACKAIITLSYYGMYQLCRAAIFHTHRNDVDLHDKVASELGRIIGEHVRDLLDFWRGIRNEVDYSPYPALSNTLKKLALDAISSAKSCLSEIENYLNKRGVKL